jgi:LPXTG-site transpeptidase (sortase) family protein
MQKPLPDNNSYDATSSSDKSPAQVNAAWEAYYAGLSDAGKKKVWLDYYERVNTATSQGHAPSQSPIGSENQPTRKGDVIVLQVTSQANRFFTIKDQLRSMAFGLVCGGVVVLVFMFALFNEMVITPFIRPSQNIDLTPVVNQAGMPVDPSPKIRISKISVDIPVVYGLPSKDEKQFELALDEGVVHYPTTVLPGQAGNAAFFGHSSNNIFNPGKYKFAFVLLHELTPGDTFYLTHDSKLYTYEVISKRVVKPTEIGVLGAVEGQVATATLITCDPPGTSTNRLVVVGKQISPEPAGNGTPTVLNSEAAEPPSVDSLPGNGPGLLNRLWRSVF